MKKGDPHHHHHFYLDRTDPDIDDNIDNNKLKGEVVVVNPAGGGDTRYNNNNNNNPSTPPPPPPDNKLVVSSSSAAAKKVITINEQRSKCWTDFIIGTFHKPLYKILHCMTSYSAKYPLTTIVSMTVVSIIIMAIGFFTNFYLESNENVLWTPTGSAAAQHRLWLKNPHQSHFPNDDIRPFVFFLHAKGQNVLNREAVRLVFNVTETIMNQPNYNDICTDGNTNYTFPNGTTITTCPISGIMRFWNHSSFLYEWTVTSEQQLVEQLSKPYYPSGAKVIDDFAFGKPIRDPTTGLLANVTSYPWGIGFPNTPEAKDMELEYADIVLKINDAWQLDNETAGYYVECRAESSFGSEFTRGIYTDIPLVPFVFIMMTAFSCAYFYRFDKVHSRALLGLAAVSSIAISILFGYGILFICGVPFTSMTQLIPFLLFGIGLDDAFILVDTYERTDPRKIPVDRIHDTINESGVSITLTTITSTLSFASGIFSTIPAVRWLCIYAAPSIALVLIFQLTLFIACIVVDEQYRIQKNRRDCCLWITVKDQSTTRDTTNWTPQDEKENFGYRAIESFCYKYMFQPRIKVIIVANFIALLGLCAYSATQLTQAFDFKDVLPKDSYLTRLIKASEEYRGQASVIADVVFRNVDFADATVHEQMDKYINDLVMNSTYITKQPDNCWFRDFQLFQQHNASLFTGVSNFNDQLKLFMKETIYYDLYYNHLGYDDNGILVTSRCQISFDNIRTDDVKSQIDALQEQSHITAAQPINQERTDNEQPFFTYAYQFNTYTFYSVCVEQLIGNTIFGIVSVTVVALLFIPHWTAAFFVGPIVCMMYIDILGVLQWAGIHINAVSFVSLVMSIGLIVDYIIHVLLRYYETPGCNRREKTVITLSTMGISVWAGGFSTFLGTVPLAFSTTAIFWIVFVSFVTLVFVAMAHGLIFLPVLLDTIGPQDYFLLGVVPVQQQQQKEDDESPIDSTTTSSTSTSTTTNNNNDTVHPSRYDSNTTTTNNKSTSVVLRTVS